MMVEHTQSDMDMTQRNWSYMNTDTAFSWLISSANTGVGTTQAYIYFSSEDQTQASTPGSLPTVSQVRASEWTLESYVNAPGPTIHTGVQDDDIWKSTRSLRPGMKLKTTLSSDIKVHHWGVGYGGTTGIRVTDQLIHIKMQLVPGDLQMIKNLGQNKTPPLIVITQQYHQEVVLLYL